MRLLARGSHDLELAIAARKGSGQLLMPRGFPVQISRRVQRAWRHTPRLDGFAVVLAGLSSGGAVYWQYRHDQSADMSVVLGTALAAFVIFVAVMFARSMICFAYRLITGKAPAGSERTLYGLDTRAIESALRASIPSPLYFSSVMVSSTALEVLAFANELRDLLTSSGWLVGGLGGAVGGEVVSDVQIRLPEGGNSGLEKLGRFLSRYGYKAKVGPGGPIGAAHVEVGEATR